ncbi:MAG: pyrroline-5-carboxylate reductase [Myxococcales bacterium]|nr:pyrroline-5-carboxylate reductase [Myxococcales bacterium]
MVSLADRNIGFIGGGNMAEALIAGLVGSGRTSAERVRASDPSAERRQFLAAAHGIVTHADNALLVEWAELLVLAVKPQSMRDLLLSLSPLVVARVAHGEAEPVPTLVVTIAAGVPIATIQQALPSARVVRAMPNTPALVGAGATALAAGAGVSAAELAFVRSMFESVGRCVEVSEAELDAVTGLSGSGPAYVMLVLEALTAGGVKMGLARDVALTLAAQTVYGAAKLQLETGEEPAVLRARVTSPGGTTVAGLDALERGGAREALVAAVEAATKRGRELAAT